MRVMMTTKAKEGHDHHTEHYEHEYKHEHKGHDRTLSHVKSTIESPPPTWATHANRPEGHWSIIEMEIGELQSAHSAMKMGTGTHAAFVKELCDVAAACVAAYTAMTCDK